jgi:protein-L-isoaspartate(D-aspartate) O-methyltransferase
MSCAGTPPDEALFRARRLELARLIELGGVRDSATLAAMRFVPRHEFVPAAYRSMAYADHPLPIDQGQTISQPSLVAYMTEIVRPRPGAKVLEVGTGSGYQAAILARTGCRVFTIEIFRTLAVSADERLRRLGFRGITVRHGDGYLGWPEEAPFDAIVVTAGAEHVPPALVAQLKPGGRMVIPVGAELDVQNLLLVEKDAKGAVRTENLLPVRFVPLLRGRR